MKDIIIIASMCVAAILIGIGLLVSPPRALTEQMPVKDDTETGAAPQQKVAFAMIDFDLHAAEVSARKNYAARDEDAYKKLWKMAHGTDGKEAPVVDFSKEYVIGVFAGEKPTGGYGIQVTSITDAGDARVITAELIAPGAGCAVTEALTSPYQIVKVPVGGSVHTAVDVTKQAPC